MYCLSLDNISFSNAFYLFLLISLQETFVVETYLLIWKEMTKLLTSITITRILSFVQPLLAISTSICVHLRLNFFTFRNLLCGI